MSHTRVHVHVHANVHKSMSGVATCTCTYNSGIVVLLSDYKEMKGLMVAMSKGYFSSCYPIPIAMIIYNAYSSHNQ